MPLYLVEPRPGKTPNFAIRGTYLGVKVDKTCGTDRRALASKQLTKLRGQIERGEYPPSKPIGRQGSPTFLSAALSYTQTGHRTRYVFRLGQYFGEMPLEDITQNVLDDAAAALFPNVTPATRNTCFYTPMSAILHHAGVKMVIRRPKGAKGRTITDSLSKEDAGGLIHAAESFDAEYALLLKFLLYTGVRLSEALRLQWDDMRLDERHADIRLTKNGKPRPLLLREDLCEALKAHSQTTNRARVFRFHQGGWLKQRLLRSKLMVCGVQMPDRPKKGQQFRTPPHRLNWVNHHTFRHTWATWMRRYGGADEIGLSMTGNWSDPRSVRRYVHAVPREEWQRVEQLPSVSGGRTK